MAHFSMPNSIPFNNIYSGWNEEADKVNLGLKLQVTSSLIVTRKNKSTKKEKKFINSNIYNLLWSLL